MTWWTREAYGTDGAGRPNPSWSTNVSISTVGASVPWLTWWTREASAAGMARRTWQTCA